MEHCRGGAGAPRKTRRSKSSIDGCSIVMPLSNGDDLLNKQQMVLFRRSSSLSAGSKPIFEVDPSYVVSRRKKSGRGLIIPSLVHKRAIRKKIDSSSGKCQFTEHGEYNDHDSGTDDLISTIGKLKNKGRKSVEHMRLSEKYEPKLFEEIVGHELNIKALSNAINREKIAPLYLFHGPHGTGKSCTARIFALASNCQSSGPCKPCKGCSKSLQLIELFSRTTTTALNHIKSILNTTDSLATKGNIIFIAENCHLLKKEVWEELLEAVDKFKGSITFVLITGDPSNLPESVSSRCQKFSFQKLTDTDISLKLARIVAQEGILINRDALFLVTQKAHGSLREADNILDQLALLGSRISAQIVRQLVGLVCEDKLTELLKAAMSSDPINTARLTKELLAVGIEPETLVSQLASRTADILSMPSTFTATTSKGKAEKEIKLTPNVSERLSNGLKILIETEKQLHSSGNRNKRTWLISAMLQLASQNTTEGTINFAAPQDIILFENGIPSNNEQAGSDKLAKFDLKRLDHLIENKSREKEAHKKLEAGASAEEIHHHSMASECINTGRNFNETTTSLVQLSNMEQIWANILANIPNDHIRQFLQHATLASLTVSTANAVVHLILKCMEDKKSAEISEENISKALEEALGSPVIVNLSIQPTESIIKTAITNSGTNSKISRKGYYSNWQQKQHVPTSEKPHTSEIELMLRHSARQKTEPQLTMSNLRRGELKQTYHGSPSQRSRDGEYIYYLDTINETRHRNSSKAPVRKRAQNKNGLHSVSLNQRNDTSVEPYSQDLVFEDANKDKQPARRRNSKVHVRIPVDKQQKPKKPSNIIQKQPWCCTDEFRKNKTKS